MSNVLHIFWDVDLRCSHAGLEAHSKRYRKQTKINIEALLPGEYVLFFNRSMSKVKLYAAHRVVAYTRSPKEGRLDPEVISRVAQAFGGDGEIDYEKHLKDVLVERLRKRSLT